MDTWSTQWKIFSSNHTFVLMALIQRCSLISTCILWSTTAAVCMRVSATRACSWLSWVHPAVLLLLRRAELRCYSAASCCAYSPSPVAVSCLAGPVCVPGSDHRSPAAVQCRGWWLKYRDQARYPPTRSQVMLSVCSYAVSGTVSKNVRKWLQEKSVSE